jgi:Tfp pilus assembly protein PilW
MLAGRLQTPFHLARDQAGFTLIETLVAILTGIVVTGALFAILEVSLHQSSRINDRVQADQLGRTAMTHIVDELHTACISPGFGPIQEKSSENTLTFINAYSKEAEIGSKSKETEVYEHKIEWTGSKTSPGNLVEYTYASSGGAWPTFTFPSSSNPTSVTRIGENISLSEVENGGTKETPPIFQYYKYGTASTSSSTTPLGTLTAVSPGTGLSKENAENISSVLISFKAGSTDGSTALNRSVDLSNQVTFAFSAPSSETPIQDSPCE